MSQIYDQSNEYTHTKEYISNFNMEENIMPHPHAITNTRDERKVCARTGIYHVANKCEVSELEAKYFNNAGVFIYFVISRIMYRNRKRNVFFK